MPTNKLPDGSTWTSFKLADVTENQEVKVTFSADINDDGVPDKYQTVTVTATTDGSGSVDPLKKEISLGEDLTFTVTPGEGHALYQVKVGDVVQYTNNDAEQPFSGTYTINDVTEDTVVTFVFSIDTDGDGIPDVCETWFTITLNHDDNTSVTSNGQAEAVKVKIGNSATVDFSANPGFAIDTVTIDSNSYVNNGQSAGPNDGGWASYTFTNVQQDHTISVTGAETTGDTSVPDKYKLTVTPIIEGSTGGQITLDPQLVVYGKDVTLTITPDEGMAVDTIETLAETYINDPNYGAAQIDGVGYDTVQEAFDEAPDGSTIMLNADITAPTTLSQAKTINLDLAGHTINVPDGKGIVADNGAKLIIGSPISTLDYPVSNEDAEQIAKSKGSVIASTTPVFAINGAEITINGGYYESLTNMAVAVGGSEETQGPGTVVINDGYFKGAQSTLLAFKTSTLTVNSGVFEALNNAVVAGNGTPGYGGTTINIHGGSFIGKQGTEGRIACGIYQPQTGVTTVDGGSWSIESGAGIVQRAGTINLSNTAFTVTGTSQGTVGDASRQIGCYGIVMDTGAGYPNYADSSITVSDGVLIESEAGSVLTTDKDGVTGSVVITGGAYSDDVQSYVQSDKVSMFDSASSHYVVKPGTLVETADAQDIVSALSQSSAVRVSITDDLASGFKVAPGKSAYVVGNTHVINGTIELESDNSELHGSLVVTDAVFDGKSTDSWAVHNQDQTETAGKSPFDVVMSKCTVQNYTKKGIYGTEISRLSLDNCQFINCATDEINEPNTYGDYVVDMNLMGVSDAIVHVNECTFKNNGAQKASIKVTARGGESDKDASDVPQGITTSVSEFVVAGCTFEDESVESDVRIGTENKSASSNPDADNQTGNFGSTSVSGSTTVTKVFTAYDQQSYELQLGQTFTRLKDSEPVVA